MTTWCTPADLLAAESDHDLLAGLATQSGQRPISGALLRAAVAAESLAEWSIEQQDAAAAAVARLGTACTTAGDLVDAYLSARWPQGLDPVPSIVRAAAVGLALEDLLGARAAEPGSIYAGLLRRAKTARDTLAALRDGALQLGSQSGADSPTQGVRHTAGASRLTTMDSLAGM